MTTMGKVDTSDLVMIIEWVIYMLSIAWTWMGQFNTYWEENKEGNREKKLTKS